MSSSKSVTWESLQTESAWQSIIPKSIPKDGALVSPSPVTWGQFKIFAKAAGTDPQKLIVGGTKISKDEDPVQGVNWVVAQRFCQWLSALSGNKMVYRLPNIEELKKLSPKPKFAEWSSDWSLPSSGTTSATAFQGFFIWGLKEQPVEIPPTMAEKNFGFRVVATKP